MYSILDSERISLRVMETNYNSPMFKALEACAIGETSHSSLRDRLVNIDVRFFERLYDQSMQVLSSHYAHLYLVSYQVKQETFIKVQKKVIHTLRFLKGL